MEAQDIGDMVQGNSGSSSSLEHTPTWAVSIVCLCFIIASVVIEACLEYLARILKKRKRKSLIRALDKIKAEMMTMGFISLLLNALEGTISRVCVTEAVANSFHPCKDPVVSPEPAPAAASFAGQVSGSDAVLSNSTDESYCYAKGMVSLISSEGVMQLRIFIGVLAVFHVFYCILTMCLGMAKIRRWKAWEKETKSIEYQIANDPRRFRLSRQTSFGRRHLKMWTDHPLLLWPVCFVRQFIGSASKADYFTLRNGFIAANVAEGSTFNFLNFLARAFDHDFEQIVEIRFWIWIFSVLFIFLSANVFYNYYWLPFIPLVLVLAVGTKLEIIITKMCVESCKNNSVTQGTFRVKPGNELFWFGRPKWLLHLLQLILIQNSFQLAFFTWAWYEYGPRSCFNQETADVAIRISMGVGVQLLCGYVTLPIYVLVAQMGSGMKRVVFTERVARGLKNWQDKARQALSKNTSTPISHLSDSESLNSIDTAITGLLPRRAYIRPPDAERQQDLASTEATTSISTPEITTEGTGSVAITRGTSYDGDISFASSWRNPEISDGASTSSQDIDKSLTARK